MSAQRRSAIAPISYLGFIYVASVAVAASYGKVGPVSVLVQDELGLSLAQVGWAVSTIDVVAAALGAVVGLGLSHRGRRAGLTTGLLVIAATNFWLAVTSGFPALVAARTAEGLGYLLACTAAPSLISTMASGRRRAVALSLWATFVPVGLSVGAFSGGVIATALGWRGWFAVVGVVVLVFGVASLLWRPAEDAVAVAERDGAPLRAREFGRPLVLGLGFTVVVALNVTVLSLFPVFLVRGMGLSVAEAGGLVGVVVLVAVPGGLATGLLVRLGVPLRAQVLLGALLVLGVFLAFTPSFGLVAVSAGFGLFAFVDGLLVAVVFAAVPPVAGRPRAITATYGVFSQLGGLGSLFGPPLLNAAVERAGWWAATPVVGAATAVGLLLLWKTVPPTRPAAADLAGELVGQPSNGVTRN
ncbi:MFS transporter [Saccharothrix australiensis]|uniref:Putative MFS family arabinose efflux permease n=1 Tax=Saccharothrix australiensis TaxID=2072 RepID=A0A495VWS9_9PSEU|nr:MFS transporter [Saccharothrix australiensis]RKT53832.1 putative MFS family arabinose efflux permease [Saccharothrix australiensis]